ncbi:MAG: dienelactone hydrolase family protein [Acidimicrobiia bacterium]
MRFAEIVLVIVVVIGIVLLGLPGRRRGLTSLLVGAAVIAQLAIEGPRWQLWPAWVAAAIIVVLDLVAPPRTEPPGPGRFVTAGVVGLAVVTLPILLPIPDLEAPDGPDAVGTASFELVDTERPEAYGDADGPRRIVVQAWYPTADTGEPVTWEEEIEVRGAAIANYLGFPDWFLDHARYTQTAAIEGATPVGDDLPVVVYSHGWRGFRTVAVDQAERLASHGFLVLAPDHTYGAIATRFDDGTVVRWDPEALPDEDDVGPEAYREARELLVETYAGDLDLVLDALADGRLDGLGEVADLETVGVYGHSTGGGAAVRFCLTDDRCDAVLGHDAWVEPLPDDLRAATLTVPALFQRSDGWRGDENDALLAAIADTAPIAWWQGIVGAEHFDFILMPEFSPAAPWIGLKGPIPADRVVPIVSDHLLAFMDGQLRDGPGLAALEPRWEPGDLETEVRGG